MEYHSFLCCKVRWFHQTQNKRGFRLLMEYHSFLFACILSSTRWCNFNSFRLLMEYHSFLFTLTACELLNNCVNKVSVSLWSIIHSYLDLTKIGKASLNFVKVSVSLWSIIHSYPMVKKVFYCNMFFVCYRESFLFLNFFYLFQIKASLTPYFLNIV